MAGVRAPATMPDAGTPRSRLTAASLARAASAIERALAQERGRWLLDASHRDSATELELTGRVGAELVRMVIDRTFVDADGVRWIVDYKTVRLPESELAQRAGHYRSQLERYARLFAGQPEPLRLAVYFPLQGRLVELPA